jgi:hypothetical protein
MKSLLALAALVAALALAAPAGAMPIVDHPVASHAAPSPPPASRPADTSDGASFLVVAIVGAAAFLIGAGAARLVRVPRRPAASA